MMPNPKHKYFLFFLLLSHLIILVVFAVYRMLGGDEGFYLNATRMVGLNNDLYTSFFYTQLPLMPTIFSSFALNGWHSFWILRGFAIAAGFLSAVLLFVIVLKTSRSLRSALITLAMYAFSGMIISMHTLYEPLVFAHFLSLGSFYFWLQFHEKKSPIYLILLGLALSALFNHRAVFLVLLPLYLWSALSIVDTRKLRSLVIFFLSLIPFSIPTLVRFVNNPKSFIFDTFLFQIYREADKSLSNIMDNRVTTLLRTVLDPHLLILLSLTGLSIWFMLKARRIGANRQLLKSPEGICLMNLLLIAGIYFVPHPILRHYMEQFLAFAIILIGLNLEEFLLRLKELIRPLQRRVILAILAGAYVFSLVPYIAINIYGIRKDDRRYLLSEVRKITSEMLRVGHVSDTVLSENAGYLFFTGQTPLPYTEIIGFHWPLPIEHENYMKYKLCDSTYLKEEIIARVPNIVTIVNNPPSYYSRELYEGYNLAYQSDAVSIFTRK